MINKVGIIRILFIIVFLSFISGCLKTENYNEKIMEIDILEKSERITGPFNIGYSAEKPNEWNLYEQIKDKYDSDVLYKEYFRNKSKIVKIYLYIILWERNYENIVNIENDLKKYYDDKMLFFSGGCEVSDERIEIIIKNIKGDIKFLNYLGNMTKEDAQNFINKVLFDDDEEVKLLVEYLYGD